MLAATIILQLTVRANVQDATKIVVCMRACTYFDRPPPPQLDAYSCVYGKKHTHKGCVVMNVWGHRDFAHHYFVVHGNAYLTVSTQKRSK